MKTGIPVEEQLAQLTRQVSRIADLMENQCGLHQPDFEASRIWEWTSWESQNSPRLRPLSEKTYLPSQMILGCETQAMVLKDTLKHFAQGAPANHALLWGKRGCGKSSLALSTIAEVIAQHPKTTRLIDVPRQFIGTIPRLWSMLSHHTYRFILFCDDLTFETQHEEHDYKTLKSILDGGIHSRANNILLIATSNRRHLMPQRVEKKHTHEAESIDETISLSDRFGVWLGFHAQDQSLYENIIKTYMRWAKINARDEKAWLDEAHIWAIQRGSRSGRVAWQFFIKTCAQKGIQLPSLPCMS